MRRQRREASRRGEAEEAGPAAGERTLGSVRTSLSMPSWKLVPVGLFFFMKSDMTFFDWPIAA
tara:strand:- start:480 stop:668 length:189 start_codon:yes stop_codon:yes gene_type:complete